MCKFGDIKNWFKYNVDKIGKMDKEEDLEKEYIKQLTPFQKIAYDIAVKKLESSFNLTLSIGYLEFLAAKSKTPGSWSLSEQDTPFCRNHLTYLYR